MNYFNILYNKKYPGQFRSNVGWRLESIHDYLNTFRPPCEKDQVLVMWDPFEFYGTTLRAAIALGWGFISTCATKKLANFMLENWVEHAKAAIDTSLVCFVLF